MLRVALFTWLFTCFVGTLILCAASGMMEHNIKPDDITMIALLALGVTLAGSIPAMLIYSLLARTLQAKMSRQKSKIICTIYAIVITAISCIIILGSYGARFSAEAGIVLLLASPYALSFAIAVWVIPWPAGYQTHHSSSLSEEPDNLQTSAFPLTTYYIVLGIGALIVLYGLSMFIRVILRDRALAATIIQLLDIGFMATALTLFYQKRDIGWKLLVLLFCGGLTASTISFLFSAGVVLRHVTQLYGYFANLLIFVTADAIALVQLGRLPLRTYYNATQKSYRTWILAGIGYGIARMAIMRVLFPY